MISIPSSKPLIIVLIIAVFILILAQGCTTIIKPTPQESYKEKALDDLYSILTPKEMKQLKALNNEDDINRFIERFWKDLDPIPETAENELKIEYEKRLAKADQEFGNHRGWGRSDQKRVFLLYGPPDFIDRLIWTDLSVSPGETFRSMEIWVYNKAAKYDDVPTIFDGIYPHQMRFIFGDTIGSGIYDLIYTTEEMGNTDPYVILRSR